VVVRRIDTATLGTMDAPVTVHLRGGMVIGDVAGVSLARVVGVWHRRPSEFATGDATDAAELRAAVGGVLAALPYLNHPADMAAAAFKPYQLALASRCGLLLPETMITSVRPVAEVFAQRRGGQVVVKPMARKAPFLVTADDRSGWQRAIHLTQQRIDTTRHVRLTVVDGGVYAARIDSPHLDWRTEIERCRYQPVDTPAEVAGPVRRLLALLRLRFAALDFAVDRDERWWFLEVNPNGQWLWIEDETGLPIAAAIATALRTPPPPGAPPEFSTGVHHKTNTRRGTGMSAGTGRFD
jgi:glutathione synthase/RimK-type ligase-like ATP-grasp enzyme